LYAKGQENGMFSAIKDGSLFLAIGILSIAFPAYSQLNLADSAKKYCLRNDTVSLSQVLKIEPRLLDSNLSSELPNDTFAYSLLHQAVQSNNKALVKFLIKKRANINLHTDKEPPPIYRAAEIRENRIEMIRLLLDLGADPSVCSKTNGYSSAIHSIASGYGEDVIPIMKLLLSNKKTKINLIDCFGETPLISAWNNHKMIRLLLEHGADPKIPDKGGDTPLHSLANEDDIGLLELMLKKGANPNAFDSRGWTPFHRACYYGSIESIKLLIKYGADRHLKTKANPINDSWKTLAGLSSEELGKKNPSTGVSDFFTKQLAKSKRNEDDSEVKQNYNANTKDIQNANIWVSPISELYNFIHMQLIQFQHGSTTLTQNKSDYTIRLQANDVKLAGTDWTLIADFWMQDQRSKSIRFFAHGNKTKSNSALDEALKIMQRQTDILCPHSYPKTYSTIIEDEEGGFHNGIHYYWGSDVCPVTGNASNFEVASISKNDAIVVWISK
jgi:ankyrin repeat protein